LLTWTISRASWKVVAAISKLACKTSSLNIKAKKKLKIKSNYARKWEAKNKP
jgi:hypothetical protein